MSYTLQLPTTIVNDAKLYASSCGTSLGHLVKMYIIELSTRKPDIKKRKLGIAEGECRIPTEAEDRAMDDEIASMFGSAADEVFDRMLVTQARSDGMLLISHDDKVIAYGESVVKV